MSATCVRIISCKTNASCYNLMSLGNRSTARLYRMHLNLIYMVYSNRKDIYYDDVRCINPTDFEATGIEKKEIVQAQDVWFNKDLKLSSGKEELLQ